MPPFETGTECFGWALEEAIEDHTPRLSPAPERCRHHHYDKDSWIGRRAILSPTPSGIPTDYGSTEQLAPTSPRRWAWWPSWRELTTHYFKEVGFLACLSQMIGATVFWISGFTALAPINSALSTPVLNGIYWLPQVGEYLFT